MIHADRDELPERLDVDEHEAVLDDRDDQRADHGADDRARAAEQARPADHDRGDRESSIGSPACAAPAEKRAV